MALDVVFLNVGGVEYTTTRATLTKYPASMLSAMFNSSMDPTFKDRHGRYFIDRDGRMFEYILNFLRSNVLSLPKNFDNFDLLIAEADYYQVAPLIEAVKCAVDTFEKRASAAPVHSPGDFLEICTTHEKRFSASNLRNTDRTTAHFAVETTHLILTAKTERIDDYIRVQMMKGSNPLGEGEEYLCENDASNISSTLIFKKYNQYNITKFRHIHQEHRGVTTNVRLRISNHLSAMGWKIVETSSTSGTYGNKDITSDIYCCEYREKWFRANDKVPAANFKSTSHKFAET